MNIEMHPSWKDFMERKDVREELNKIEKALENEEYYPAKENVFRFLQTDKNNIKVLIMGMEPYASSYIDEDGNVVPMATGRSFEVGNLKSWQQKFRQTSMQNILKAIYLSQTREEKTLNEIKEKIADGSFKIKQPTEWFDGLEKQGVLFLNASLSVQKGVVRSHAKIWQNFMNLVIQELDTQTLLWMLWGNKSKEVAVRVFKVLENNNYYIIAHHPRTAAFVHDDCFSNPAVKNINWLG